MHLDPKAFGALIQLCWSAKSASTYSRANPALGQCSVTTLLAQDCLGGILAKTKVGQQWHWYNCIDGERFDFTASQFEKPIKYDDLPSDRSEALTDTTAKQYLALKQALDRIR